GRWRSQPRDHGGRRERDSARVPVRALDGSPPRVGKDRAGRGRHPHRCRRCRRRAQETHPHGRAAPPADGSGRRASAAERSERQGDSFPSRDPGEGTRADVRVLRRPSGRGPLLLHALPREPHPRALRLSRHANKDRASRSAGVIDSPASAVALGLVGLVGYLVGSISSGYIVGRIYRNVDLRTVGSGSTGATNTFRTLGTGAGVLVAVLDILKGAGAVVFAQLIFPTGSDLRPLAEAVAAVTAVAGHCWPVPLR